MILNNADDIRIGSEEVIEVRSGSDLIWSRNQFWTFDTPEAGTQLRVLADFYNLPVTINWGDGTSDSLSQFVPKTHVY